MAYVSTKNLDILYQCNPLKITVKINSQNTDLRTKIVIVINLEALGCMWRPLLF